MPVGIAAGQTTFKLDAQDQWQAQRLPDPNSPEGRLLAIRKVLAEDDGETAEEMATQWIDELPNHPLLVEAYLLRADAKVAQRLYFKSLFDYEYLIGRFPASEQFNTALEREYEIARLFAAGMKRKWLGMRILSADAEAEEIFVRIQERSPGSTVAHDASLALGDFYFDRQQMENAAEAYDLFLGNYPRSDRREYAMLRLIQANLARFQGPEFDASGLIEASQRLKVYAREFPVAAERLGSDALLVRIEESLALKLYYSARWYQRTGEAVSAAYLYKRVLTDYPKTAAARSALQRLSDLQDRVPSARLDDVQPLGEPTQDDTPAAASDSDVE